MRGFLIALLVWMCLPIMAVAQDADRDRLTAFLEDNLSGAGRKVTVTGFRGAFSSRAEMDSLTIADDEGIWITLTGVVLDWNRTALLQGVVEVNELLAKEVIVARAPVTAGDGTPTPEAKGFALPELPVSVNVKKLAAERVVLGAALLGQEVEGSLEASAALEGGEGRATLQILRGGDGPEGRIALTADYTNATKNLVIDLDAAEGPGGIAATLLGLPGEPEAALIIKGAGPLDDFAADILLQTDGVERLAGKVTLKGVEDGAQKFSADLGGDLAPLFLPEYAAFFGTDVRLQADGTRSKQGQLDLSRLTLNTKALVLDGAVLIATDGLPQRISVTGRLGLPDGEPVLLPLSGDIETRVAAADLQVSFDAANDDGWSGSAVLSGLVRKDILLTRAKLIGSGRINRRGGEAGPVLGATLSFEATGVQPADTALAAAIGSDMKGGAILHWQPGGKGLQIGKLALEGPGYSVSTVGRIGDLESGFRLTGKAKAQYDDLFRLSGLAGRPLGGAAEITATGEGSVLGGDFDTIARIAGTNISTGIAELDGVLQGQTVIDLSAKRDKTGLVLRELELTARQLVARASGNLASDSSDVKADLTFSDLTVLGPGYRGSLRADATFAGTPTQGRVTLDGIGRDLKIGQRQADAALAGESVLSVAVDLREGRYEIEKADIRNPQITAKVIGHYAPDGSDLSANISLPDLSPIGPGYRGSLRADLNATGTVEDGRLTLEGVGRNLTVGQAEADRLLAGDSDLSVAVNIKGRRLEIERANIRNPQITASASGSVTDALRQVVLDARLANLALLVPDFPGALALSGTIKEDGSGFAVDMKGQGPGGIDGRISGRLAKNLRSADLAINGMAQAALANVFLANRSISGQTQLDLRLNGPLALSSLSGTIGLSGGRFSAPTLPLGLKDIAATANLGGNAIRLDMTAASTTDGQIAVNGTVGLAAPNDGNLNIALSGLRLKDPDLYDTVLNGSLTVKGPLTGGALIAGTIQVGETELRVPSTGLGVIGSVPGLKHVNEPAQVRKTRGKAGLLASEKSGGSSRARPYGLEVRIEAPARIFLRGRGIDAELGGRITLRGTTDNVIPAGGFSLIRGRLDILGKRLDLDRARLLMQGDLVPYLDIAATTESDGITTSVLIKGPADEPEISFESSPDLPQEEVLARLLFGRGLEKISALQAAQLANAVATLAGKGGEGIVSKLRKGFGLDDLDLATDGEGNTSVKAGKYISRNTYTEIEVDQQGRSKINLNLDIKKGVKLRGSVGADGQAGIGVFVEKDY